MGGLRSESGVAKYVSHPQMAKSSVVDGGSLLSLVTVERETPRGHQQGVSLRSFVLVSLVHSSSSSEMRCVDVHRMNCSLDQGESGGLAMKGR